MTEETALAAAAPAWDGDFGVATSTTDAPPKSTPRDGEVAFKLPLLKRWIGRLCCGKPSIACWLFAAAPIWLGAEIMLSALDGTGAGGTAAEVGMKEPNALLTLVSFAFAVPSALRRSAPPARWPRAPALSPCLAATRPPSARPTKTASSES